MRPNALSTVIWVLAAAILATQIRNPLYLTQILVSSTLLNVVFARDHDFSTRRLLRIGIFFVLLSSIYNGFFVHGGKTILFTIPDWPLVGGPVTIEAIIDGARNGYFLFTLLAIFASLNSIVSPASLLRLIPTAFQDLGVIAVLAITYLPETKRQLTRIREAQAIRGHTFAGIRDWQAIAVPLMVGSLERAMRLAEAMVARGYGNTRSQSSSIGERLALTSGLIAALAGVFLLFWIDWVGWLSIGFGIAIVLLTARNRNRVSRRTTYEELIWTRVDIFMLVTISLNLFLILPTWRFIDQSSLDYSPYPVISVPDFDLILGLLFAAMMLPLLAPNTLYILKAKRK